MGKTNIKKRAPKKSAEEQIEALAEKQKLLQQRIKLLKGKEREKQRKDDTRRKILLGAWVLKEMEERGDDFKAEVTAGLDKFLERPRDRALFGLGSNDSG